MTRFLKTVIVSAATLAAALAPAAASARGSFAATHPRRAEVNSRLENQHDRIRNQVAAGDLTHAQAQHLRREDRSIRREERNMARFDGGHLTRADQRALNQQENAVSRQIGQ